MPKMMAERDDALIELNARVGSMFAFDSSIHPNAVHELERLLKVAYGRGYSKGWAARSAR